MIGFRGMTIEQKKAMIQFFQKQTGLNFAIDPAIEFDEIPEPFRSRMFLPKKRKANDPIAFQKIGKKIHTIY